MQGKALVILTLYKIIALVKDISQVLQMRGKNLPVGGILICLFGYFTYTLSFTVFETIGTPYTQVYILCSYLTPRLLLSGVFCIIQFCMWL